MKYIFVCGGVMSGIGKGVTAASLAVFLKFQGHKVTMIKIDPYLNIDAGTMSPYEHGECFVLDDGTECDLDLGTYERFLDIQLTGDHNLTGGKLLQRILRAERQGDYLGKTVQIVPHMTDAIQRWIQDVAQRPVKDWFYDGKMVQPEICIVELGGTAGDIEGMPYFEAIRQLIYKLPHQDTCVFHVTYVPVLHVNREPKTKPAQQGVKILRQLGIVPDFLCVRFSSTTETTLNLSLKRKLGNYCHINPHDIIMIPDVDNIYTIPLELTQIPEFSKHLGERLGIRYNTNPQQEPFFKYWTTKQPQNNKTVRVGIVGKYTATRDTYLSLLYAIKHAAWFLGHKPHLEFIEAETFDETIHGSQIDVMIIPGGFGKRGIEGMIRAAHFARTKGIPLLGICLGLHVMTIELARNILGFSQANSQEFQTNIHSQTVVQEIDPSKTNKGGTMTLGLLKTTLDPTTRSYQLYKKYGRFYDQETATIQERHRHRFEVSTLHAKMLETHGFTVTWTDHTRVDLIESSKPDGPFYIGCQFHPELLTRHTKPHPLFIGLLQSGLL